MLVNFKALENKVAQIYSNIFKSCFVLMIIIIVKQVIHFFFKNTRIIFAQNFKTKLTFKTMSVSTSPNLHGPVEWISM